MAPVPAARVFSIQLCDVVLSDLSLRTFSSSDVRAMELNILIALDYSIWRVTPFDFLLFALAALEATPPLVFCSFVGLCVAIHHSIFWKVDCFAGFSMEKRRRSQRLRVCARRSIG